MSTRLLQFRCDDAGGFELKIFQQHDGDFIVSIIPNKEDMRAERYQIDNFNACYSASVRIRAPITGGGSHEALWHSIAKLFEKPQARVSGHYRENL